MATALVTGAAHGLGLEVARQLASAGLDAIIAGRDVGATNRAADSCGGVRAAAVPLDVADRDSVHTFVEHWAKDPGCLDVLINNAAGYVDWSEMASVADLDAAEQVMQVNLYGSWRVVQAFLPLLRLSSHPRIVNSAAARDLTPTPTSDSRHAMELPRPTASARQLSTHSRPPWQPSWPTRRSWSTPSARG